MCARRNEDPNIIIHLSESEKISPEKVLQYFFEGTNLEEIRTSIKEIKGCLKSSPTSCKTVQDDLLFFLEQIERMCEAAFLVSQ